MSSAPQDHPAGSGERRSDFFDQVLREIPDPSTGLPDDVFKFVLAITPMINVDLLVDGDQGVLLAWREDAWGRGWHVPGGIIRFNEPTLYRINEVARLELGTAVVADPTPIALSQFFAVRGHFLSLLYRCIISGGPPRPMAPDPDHPQSGELSWFRAPPAKIYPAHLDYIPRLSGFGGGDVLTLAESPVTLASGTGRSAGEEE